MNAQEYQVEHNKLMTKWEKEARSWLAESNKELSEQIPFFRDGVTCPEVWFEEGNDFRPLFILKEVSIGKNYTCEIPDFLATWNNNTMFEFAQYEFDDVKVGSFPQWRRIARLAKAFEDVHNGIYPCDYSRYDFGSLKGDGKEYIGNIDGYKGDKYKQRTSNKEYDNIINKIAILELKKLGGGQTVGSKLSIATGYYTEHIEKFADNIKAQIDIIQPTVIIGLGRENGHCITQELLEKANVNQKLKDVIQIKGYHHVRSSNKKFYDDPLEKYAEAIKVKNTNQ